MQKIRIAFRTLGCKLNFSETSTISRQFGLDNFELVDFNKQADVYVVHTCSVTAVAEKKCKTSVKQAHKRNPLAKIAVIGCAVQVNPELFARMEGVNWTLGNQDKFQLGKQIQAELKVYHSQSFGHNPGIVKVSDINKKSGFIPSFSINDRTRSFFKVQDGCDYFCSYCSIPFMRGRSRNNSVEATMQVAREIALTQVKEIILTGVNIGHFGHGTEEKFIDLLQQFETLEGIDRIRISSIEPELLTDEIIHLVADSHKLLPHFHIPLQSGNDKILALMKRKYKREVFESRVKLIRNLMPDACIAADVIVGFPGETGEDFLDSCTFIQNSGISYLHIFTYSERPGTLALHYEDKVSDREKHRRSHELHVLSEISKRAFYEGQVNKVRQVLWESDKVHGWMHGWTENYMHVRTGYEQALVNTITPCRILRIVSEDELIGEVEILDQK